MHALRTAKLEAITTRTSKHCRMHEPALSDQFGPVHPLTSFGQRHRYGSLPNHTNPRRNGYSDGIRAREFGLKLQLSSLSARTIDLIKINLLPSVAHHLSIIR
jgi:hypothetical protein